MRHEHHDDIIDLDAASSRYSDYLRGGGGGKRVADSSTSDYSTSSSNTNTLDSRASLRVGRGGGGGGGGGGGNYSSDYASSQPSPAHSRQNSHVLQRQDHTTALPRQSTVTSRAAYPPAAMSSSNSQQQPPPSMTGKFFVMSSTPSPLVGRRVTHDDMDIYKPLSPRVTPRASNVAASFDVAKIVGNSTLQRREKDVRGGGGGQRTAASGRCDQQQQQAPQRYGGSLDSLIDARLELHNSSFYDTTDSEQGELYQSLVTDFDRRLNDLKDSNAAASVDLSPRHRSKTMDSTSPRTSKPARPDSIILTVGGDRHLVPREFVDKFRDPSLHRVTPPEGSDPQIGVAYRFERKDFLLDYAASRSGQPSAADSKSVKFQDSSNQNPDQFKPNIFRDMLTHSSRGKDTPDRAPTRPPNPRRPRAPSPVVLRRQDPDARKKREHRRHTVAGLDSAEHLQALATLTDSDAARDERSESTHDDAQLSSSSAWERLQPRHGVAPVGAQVPPRNLQLWLQEERLRQARSASDLLDLDEHESLHEPQQQLQWKPSMSHRGGGDRALQSSLGQRPRSMDLLHEHAQQQHFSPSEQRSRRRRRRESSESPKVLSPVSPMTSSRFGFPTPSPQYNNTGDSKRTSRNGRFTFESSL